jgi:hypothetical protein
MSTDLCREQFTPMSKGHATSQSHARISGL